MNTRDNDRFDADLRQTWRDAAGHLPGPLQLQLSPAMAAQRKRAASRRSQWGWPAAGAFASMALAIGLWWSSGFDAPISPAAAPGTQLATDAAAITFDDDTASELLTRNPDFYAWLGTEEARSLAME